MTKIKLVSLAIAAMWLGSSLPAQTLNVPGGTVGNISGSNVGVGTSSPAAKVHIVKDGAVAADYGLSQLFVGGTDGNKRLAVAFDTTNNIGLIQAYVQGGAVQNLALQSAGGNVGIGATSPIDKLQISNAGDVRVVLMPLNGANNRESLVDFWATFDNYPSDVGVRRAGRIQVGFDGSVWGTEYMAFGVAGAGDGSNPPIERMRITAAGNVGIGTTNPLRPIHLYAANGYCEAMWEAGAVSSSSLGRIWRWGTDPSGNFSASTLNAGLTAGLGVMTLLSNGNVSFPGNVGIGTSNPTQKLSVNGTVRAKEVIVDTGWSDFVFDESYELKALSETEAFIQSEKHLPGIPSASEVAEHGISLGDMQARLLAKIEEITLHQIAQEKLLAAQSAQLSDQSARIKQLEAENLTLKSIR